MAINLIEVLPRTLFDFSGGSATHVVARAVDLTNSSSGSLLVRVHGGGSVPVGDAIHVRAQVASPSREDPQTDFLGPVVASVTVPDSATPTPPMLLKDDLDEQFGGHLWIEVEGEAGTSATLSITLAMKA